MRVELRGITRSFGTLVANRSIDLTVLPGEIHALLGENGAGKTTLMNVLYGLLQPDAGQLLFDGRLVVLDGPGDAIRAGIGMVHQHFMLVPNFTVAENLILGDEPVRRLGLLDLAAARDRIETYARDFGLVVEPDALVEDLEVGEQQRVEIVKTLMREAQLLVMDEPTAALTPQETEELFGVLRALRDQGRSILFITHKLEEVRAIADRITVLCKGEVVGEASPRASAQELAAMMVGRPVRLRVDKPPATPAQPVLVMRDLVVRSPSGAAVVDGVSLSVRGGEVVALAGVQGNGQIALVETVMGLRRAEAGEISLDGADLTAETTAGVLARGVGYIPEDRQGSGLVGAFSVAENLVLDVYKRSPFASGLRVRHDAVSRHAAAMMERFDIRAASMHAPAASLSGGNQQKVVAARELSRPLKLVVAVQPTRGLDVGAMEFIHTCIIQARDAGAAVLLVSTELEEVFALADRIAVMYRGRIVDVVDPEVSADEIGLLMAGGVREPR